MVCKVVIWFEQAILSLYYYFFTKFKKTTGKWECQSTLSHTDWQQRKENHLQYYEGIYFYYVFQQYVQVWLESCLYYWS